MFVINTVLRQGKAFSKYQYFIEISIFIGNHSCAEDQFKCTLSYCIDVKDKCDMIIDCKMTYVDELDCGMVDKIAFIYFLNSNLCATY